LGSNTEQISANLWEEKSDLMEHLSQSTITDDQLAYIKEFCAKIRGRLEQADFDTKRQIIELLDVRCKIDIEDGEKVIWLKCLIEPQEQLQVLRTPTSHLSSDHNRHPVIITARLVLQLISNLKIQYTRGELPIVLEDAPIAV
jgi:hypothetical protein